MRRRRVRCGRGARSTRSRRATSCSSASTSESAIPQERSCKRHFLNFDYVVVQTLLVLLARALATETWIGPKGERCVFGKVTRGCARLYSAAIANWGLAFRVGWKVQQRIH